jgi:hypothetical protein
MRDSRLAQRKCAAAHLSGDEGSKVRAEFLAMKEFQKSREKVLCRVIAAEQEKYSPDLCRRAVESSEQRPAAGATAQSDQAVSGQ